MADKMQQKSRKRKHFEMENARQSPFQKFSNSKTPSGVVSKAPRGLNVMEFAESRAMEIQNMMQALSTASQQSNKRVFQSLPRHMRRRAASHNSKRLPVRLREAHNREVLKSQEKQKEPSKEKKSRRHRRKASDLLTEYNRRQRNHVWLETHIWHAKRFKMVEKWGYKVPLHPNDKSIRASYRAMSNGCLLQDISYYQCIEVEGRRDLIVTALKHITSSDLGLTMIAKDFLTGRYEGHAIIYKYDQYPNHAIGPVMFLWQHTRDEGASQKLWIWSHPSCANEIIQEVQQACFTTISPTEFINSTSTQETTDALSTTIKTGDENLMTSSKEFQRKNCEIDEKALIEVRVIKEELVRLRLTGSKSHALLAATLDLCEWSVKRDGSRWWERYTGDDDGINCFVEQNKNWKEIRDMTSPGVLKAGSVIALVVKDPRLGLPLKRCSIDIASEDLYHNTASDDCTITSSLSPTISTSPLWNSHIRKETMESKISEKNLNKMRSQLSVPGSRLNLGDDASRIPIMLIQQPGATGNRQSDSMNFGSGYDLVFPSSWSMAFWIAFVYRGARVGGARELQTCSREKGLPHFPCDFPDTTAGIEYNNEQKRIGEDKHQRYPPAKRPNYDKLGIISPFAPDWNALVSNWSDEVKNITVMMQDLLGGDGCTVEGCQPITESDNVSCDVHFNVLRSLSTRRRLQNITVSLMSCNKRHKEKISKEEILKFLINNISLHSRSLVTLRVRPLMKGCPTENTVIFLPSTQDFIKLRQDKTFSGPVEEVLQSTPSSTVIGQSSRKTIGWITSGQYSFSRGHSSAIGFCHFYAFCELITRTLEHKTDLVVLLRNSNNFQYRFASINVV